MNNTGSQTSSALSEFWDFAKDFKSLTSWVAKAAIAAPLTDILLNIGPPWPSRLGVAILVCIVEVLVLMFSFEFWRRRHTSVRAVQRVMKLAVLAVALSFMAYVWLFAGYVEDAPDAWHRVVIGTTYHENIRELVLTDARLYNHKELLERFERDPMNIWTKQSVTTMRVLVLAGWLTFWTSLSCVLASFVALQWRRRNHLVKSVGKKSSNSDIDRS